MAKALESEVHRRYVEPILRTGRPPSGRVVAEALGIPLAEVHSVLRTLADGHGLVLHPHVCEPWIVHPFATSPSATWVEGANRGWWAPCMWCAFGIAALADESVTIHSRLGGEREDVDIHVSGGRVVESDLLVHFAVPPRAAWDNVHHFCATVLPFRTGEEVRDWCARHLIPLGSIIPIQQCADLGHEWYAPYADPDWRKWSVRQASEIFARVGLHDEFWTLPKTDGGF